ncbi:MAG: hypothetical protein IKO10_08680 [Lachnospiraceae bacterium]|nr:hypothetical protein [Lachnospiraceae bacterium]
MNRVVVAKNLIDLQKDLEKVYGLNEDGKETFRIAINTILAIGQIEEQITDEVQEALDHFEEYANGKNVSDQFCFGLMRAKDIINQYLEEKEV